MLGFEGGPGEIALTGIAGFGEGGPGGGHFGGEGLGFRGVAGALFAAFGVIEAEGKFRGMPGAGIFEDGGLPGEEVGEDGSGFLVEFEFRHFGDVVADLQAGDAVGGSGVRVDFFGIGLFSWRR